MNSRKLTFFIPLVFLVSSCQGNPIEGFFKQPPSVTPSPEAAVTPSVTPSPQAAVTPLASPSPEAVVTPLASPSPDTVADSDPPDEIFSGELQNVVFKCGEPVYFKSLKLFGECPVDEEKDGRPHGDNFKFQISNPSQKDVYLTDGGDNNRNTCVRCYYSLYRTIIMKPEQSLKGILSQNDIDWSNKTFHLLLGTGKVDISALNYGGRKFEISADPTDTFSQPLSCEQRVGQTNDMKKFGVHYQLNCNPQRTTINILNDAVETRSVSIKYNSEGIDGISTLPYMSPGNNQVISLPINGKYEITIMILKQKNQAPNP